MSFIGFWPSKVATFRYTFVIIIVVIINSILLITCFDFDYVITTFSWWIDFILNLFILVHLFVWFVFSYLSGLVQKYLCFEQLMFHWMFPLLYCLSYSCCCLGMSSRFLKSQFRNRRFCSLVSFRISCYLVKLKFQNYFLELDFACH